MSTKKSYAADVVVFYTNSTKDVELKGNCFVYESLSVLGTSLLSIRLTVMCDGFNGSTRCVPIVDTSESSLTVYRYTDMRFAAASDMWLMGQNSWFNTCYSIGTPGTGMCLSIATDGNVTMPYVVKASEIMVDITRALTVEQITIDDNVSISRSLVVNGVFNYSSSNVAYTAPVDSNLGQIFLNGVLVIIEVLLKVVYQALQLALAVVVLKF
jgi:hypothetical protein